MNANERGASAGPSHVISDRPSQPIDRWWTEADAAELDVLIHELTRGYFEHRERCASCLATFPPCPHVRTAITAVLEWLEARELRSRAEWLRAERDRIKAAA